MKKNPLLSLLACLASLFLVAGATAAVETPRPEQPATAMPAPDVETASPELVAPAPKAEVENMSSPIEDCELQCHQQFTACRQGAGNSGGPGFPGGSFEACVDELESCLAVECGIGC